MHHRPSRKPHFPRLSDDGKRGIARPRRVPTLLLLTAIGRQDLPDVSRFAERQRRLLRDFAKYVEEQEAEQPVE